MRKGHFAEDSVDRIGVEIRVAAAVGLTAVLAVAVTYFDVIWFIEKTWRNSPDYSHGYLVLPFVAIVVWTRLTRLTTQSWSVSLLAVAAGVLLILVATFIRSAGVYMRMVTLEALSLIPCLGGVTLIGGGWRAARQAWAPIAFLAFMVPLPREFSTLLSSALQRTATQVSTFSLQLCGIPAVAEGNVIQLTSETIGVAEACSGIRMLVCFISLTVGACLLSDRPVWEKLVLIASAPLIAIVANVTRLVATGIAFETGGQDFGKLIFHDLAGWLMMPIGLGLLLAEMSILSKLLVGPESRIVPKPVRDSVAAG